MHAPLLWKMTDSTLITPENFMSAEKRRRMEVLFFGDGVRVGDDREGLFGTWYGLNNVSNRVLTPGMYGNR